MHRNNNQMNLYGKGSLPIVGCLVLFSVVLGTTDLGFIPVPTAAKKCDHHALAHYRGESA